MSLPNLKVISGGWYCRALPTREWAAFKPNVGVDTHLGRVGLLDLNRQLVHLDITNVGGFRIAGQCWPSEDPRYKDRAIEWLDLDNDDNGVWVVGTRVAVGERCVAYGPDGRLNICDGTINGRGTSQGYAGVEPDGTLLLADDFLAPRNGLQQWRELPNGWIIGQRGAAGDAIHVWDGAVYREVVDGMCRHPHFKWAEVDGVLVLAISTYRIREGSRNLSEDSVLGWATMAELAALPEVVTPVVRPVKPKRASWGVAGCWSPTLSPGNMAILTPGMPVPSHPLIVASIERINDVSRERLAGLLVYVVGDDANARAVLSLGRDAANELGVPAFIYDDRADGRLALAQSVFGSTRFVWSPQWYRQIGETLPDFRARIVSLRASYGSQLFAPTIRAYCSLNNRDKNNPFDAVPENEVIEGLNTIIDTGAMGGETCLGPWFFAWNRGDGAIARPAVREAVELWCDIPTTYTTAATLIASILPKEIPVRPIDTNVHATIRRFVQFCPFPIGDPGEAHENRLRSWMRALTEQIVFSHGPKYGWKRAAEGRPNSKETFALQEDGFLHGWELFEAAGTGNPKLLDTPEYKDLTTPPNGPQVFVPMQPVDRLGRRSNRPKLPTDWRCSSGFDLGARLQSGDRRWLDDSGVGFARFRVMVARFSGPTPRTMAEGLIQTRLSFEALRGTKQFAHVVMLCDTKGTKPSDNVRGLDVPEYTRDEMREQVKRINALMVQYADMVQSVEVWNEAGHPTQSGDSMDVLFTEELMDLVDVRFPIAHGGEFETGSYVTWHSDRGTSPEDNARYMGARQVLSGKEWVDDEMLGGTEPDRVPGRQRSADPGYFQRAARADKAQGLRVTLHTDAGLTCDIAEVGPVHREIKRVFLAEFPVDLPGPGPVPVGHPILDQPLFPTDAAFYKWFINNGDKIIAAAIAWYTKYSKGRPPARTDIWHGIYQAIVEGKRWGTLRKAWGRPESDGGWPGGAPD